MHLSMLCLKGVDPLHMWGTRHVMPLWAPTQIPHICLGSCPSPSHLRLTQLYIDRCRIYCSSTKIDKRYCIYFLYVFLPNLQTTTLSVYCSLLKCLIWLPSEQQRSLISTFDIKRGSHSLGFVFIGFIHPCCPENYTQVCFDRFKLKLLS